MVRILISGIFGHMGRNVAELVEADKDCELLCGVDLKAGEMNGAPVYASFSDVKEKADAVIDFSSAANLANVLSYAEKFGVPVVLAATGYTEADLKAIGEASKKVAVFKTANLSVGINLLQKLVKEAAAFLGENFDIEIVEKHPDLCQSARGLGFMRGIELKIPPRDVISRCMEKGLLVCSAGYTVLRFVPPLIATREDIDKAAAIVDAALSEI